MPFRPGPPAVIAVLACAVLAASCSDAGVVPDDLPAERAFVVRPASAHLGTGEGLTFAAWWMSAGDSVRASVQWTTTGGTIDPAGRFVAPPLPGEVRVVARDASGSGRADTSRVTVDGPDPARPASLRITVGDALVLVAGQAADLVAEVVNAYGGALAGVPVEWTSSVPGVARVDGSGRVTAEGPGEASVVAAIAAVGLADTTLVRVTPIPVASVVVEGGADSIPLGGETTFTARPLGPTGEDLPGRTVAWRVVPADRASVDGGGRVSGLAPGTVEVRATVEGVEGAASLVVTDTAAVVAAVNVVPGAVALEVGTSEVLTAVATDAGGAPIPGLPVAWTSSAPDVAEVDDAGLVRGASAGTALVSATIRGVRGSTHVTVTEPSPPPVASVTVTPASVVLAVGESRDFSVVARAADGSVLAGRSVDWSSSATGVVTVDGTGSAEAVAPGTARIRATVEGVAGEADVTVPAPPPVVASVEVTPGTTTVDVGSVVTLTATARDGDGVAIPGAPVDWTSLHPGLASVDGGGVVSGLAPGAATIRATSDGVEGTAAVTVQDPGPGPSLANECDTPDAAWIWCDDFDQDRSASYFEFNQGGGSFQRVAGVGAEGSSGMRARWAAGQVDAGALHLAVGRTPQGYMRPADAGTADYRELYWRVYLRYAPGWVGGGGYKVGRAFVFASPTSWAQAMIAHAWSGGTGHSRLYIDPARGTDEAGNLVTTTYNDFDNLSWLGSAGSATPIFDADHVGAWYCIEVRVRLNDAGQANGVLELWIDGESEARREGLNFLGAFDAYGLNAVFLENYWNDGAPAAQERYFDNFVVSTSRIGC